jgi:hypothetical protein
VCEAAPRDPDLGAFPFHLPPFRGAAFDPIAWRGWGVDDVVIGIGYLSRARSGGRFGWSLWTDRRQRRALLAERRSANNQHCKTHDCRHPTTHPSSTAIPEHWTGSVDRRARKRSFSSGQACAVSRASKFAFRKTSCSSIPPPSPACHRAAERSPDRYCRSLGRKSFRSNDRRPGQVQAEWECPSPAARAASHLDYRDLAWAIRRRCSVRSAKPNGRTG